MRITILLASAALVASIGPVSAQPQPGAEAPAAFESRAVIDAVRKAIRENYVLPARRGPYEAALAKALAAGRYAVTDPEELARRINADLAAVAVDKHLGLSFNPDFARQLGDRPAGDELIETELYRNLARSRNHGVRELRVLDGNIRLLRYDGFDWTGPESAAALDGAAAFLRGGDAIVIDLRNNGGGSPDAVRRLASYFVPAGKTLVTFHMRNDPPAVSVSEEVPGGTIKGVPLYVLISPGSASAAEEFASHVAGFKFGTLVGETTAGAGYRNEFVPIPGGFVLSISVGRPELPDGSDWEAKGVAPAIRTPVDQALDRAQQAALDTLAARAQGPRKTELEWAAAALGARLSPAAPTRDLGAYAGRYGPRAVSIEQGRLMYRRDGGVATTLLPIGPDLFAMEADPRGRVRFRTAGGTVSGFAIERADGSVTEQERTGS